MSCLLSLKLLHDKTLYLKKTPKHYINKTIVLIHLSTVTKGDNTDTKKENKKKT